MNIDNAVSTVQLLADTRLVFVAQAFFQGDLFVVLRPPMPRVQNGYYAGAARLYTCAVTPLD